MDISNLKKKLSEIFNNDNNNDNTNHNLNNEDDDDCDMLHNVYMIKNDIYFRTDVTLKSVDSLIKIIKKCNQNYKKAKRNKYIKYTEPRPLKLHITSYGGSLMAGLLAADAIEKSKIPIYTIVEGYAASAATFMSIVGIKRYITPRSHMLIHQLRTCGFFNMKYDEQKDEYKNNKMLMKNVIKLYKKKTKLSIGRIKRELKHDLWRNSEKCLKVGLVDYIK